MVRSAVPVVEQSAASAVAGLVDLVVVLAPCVVARRGTGTCRAMRDYLATVAESPFGAEERSAHAEDIARLLSASAHVVVEPWQFDAIFVASTLDMVAGLAPDGTDVIPMHGELVDGQPLRSGRRPRGAR